MFVTRPARPFGHIWVNSFRLEALCGYKTGRIDLVCDRVALRVSTIPISRVHTTTLATIVAIKLLRSSAVFF